MSSSWIPLTDTHESDVHGQELRCGRCEGREVESNVGHAGYQDTHDQLIPTFPLEFTVLSTRKSRESMAILNSSSTTGHWLLDGLKGAYRCKPAPRDLPHRNSLSFQSFVPSTPHRHRHHLEILLEFMWWYPCPVSFHQSVVESLLLGACIGAGEAVVLK